MARARACIKGLMPGRPEVRVDTAGNLIGRRPGSEDRPPILIGSHIDSVPGGGNYDGDVGVIGAIEVAQVLQETGTGLRHPLEVVVFADEEGGLSGSRAMIGKLGPEALQVASHSGLTIADGIRAIGGDPERLAEAQRRPGDVTAFVELHIEQGAVLDDAGVDIGVVTGIVGIQWWDVIVTGVANHAGTTPMNKRQDALLAAAELVLAVNRVVTAEPGAQVGTVGRIAAEPGAPNVVPGRVTFSLELRDLSEETIFRLYRGIETSAAIAGAAARPSIPSRRRRATPLTDERIRAHRQCRGAPGARPPCRAAPGRRPGPRADRPDWHDLRTQRIRRQPLTAGIHAAPGHGQRRRRAVAHGARHRPGRARTLARLPLLHGRVEPRAQLREFLLHGLEGRLERIHPRA
jgi:acetylornithine deacetylase/succinyl-diaminopimelate desuccinylase-like protein